MSLDIILRNPGVSSFSITLGGEEILYTSAITNIFVTNTTWIRNSGQYNESLGMGYLTSDLTKWSWVTITDPSSYYFPISGGQRFNLGGV